MKLSIFLFPLLLFFQGTEKTDAQIDCCDPVETIIKAGETYEFKGIVMDEAGEGLIGASVLMKGTNRGAITDIYGHFSIPSPDSCATLLFSYTGFDTQENPHCHGPAIKISLKKSSAMLDEVVVTTRQPQRESRKERRLMAAPAPQQYDMAASARYAPPPPPPAPAGTHRPEPMNGDSYAEQKENSFIATDTENLSTFSIDVDAAGYSNVRRFLNEGDLPPTAAVRSEEMINYFRYSYPQPSGDAPFHVATELAECPWNNNNQLLLVGMRGKSMSQEELPAANFVFLLDVSGSMNGQDRLGLLKSSLLMLTDNLREQDKVSIVVYAGSSGMVLAPTSGANKQKINEALNRLQAGGSTAGAAGILQAYEVARANFVEGGNNRVVLATDGDFNVGVSSNEALEELIVKERENGIFLSVLGFGRGNLQDDKMEMLADKGNGNYAYIDQLSEARKVLVSEFGGTLFTIAKDVKIQVDFDPQYVQAYRLIGYENRMLAKEDFRDDTKDAGELGVGHTITALYEIIPAPGYTRAQSAGMVRLRYKAPDSDTSQELAYALGTGANSFGQSSVNLRWATAVAEFSMLLRDSEHKGTANYEHCAELARQAQGRDPFGYRQEMIGLVEKAAQLQTAVAEGK